ncbi:MAG: sensor histidine kinase [Deltaproteobacteria bacterium]|nr:sensor histidine kinase [Deltaproteobacteria bacterium]
MGLNHASRILLCVLGAGLVAWLDFITGAEINISIFYLLPIAVVAWHYGRIAALGTAALAALIWRYMEHLSGPEYSSTAIAVWNVVVRFSYFSIAALALDVVHRQTILQTARTVQRATEDQLRLLAGRLHQGREEERIALARDVHDNFGQALTGLKLEVVALQRHTATADTTQQTALAAKFAGITQTIDGAINEVRRIATGLRPPVLDTMGLYAAIEWQARDFQARTGITCDCTVPKEEAARTPHAGIAVFRIVQEILTNIQRHANATRVVLLVYHTPEQTIFEVRDNGRGIRLQESESLQAIGLLGMRERAQGIGGLIAIEGIPEHGTTVRLTIPWKGAAHDTHPDRG